MYSVRMQYRVMPAAQWRHTGIDGSEPMQNDQEHFFSDIFLKIYNIVKI